MTSKEALKRIYNTGANMVIDTPLDNFFKEEVKAIAKDLEILEIIRKNIYEGGYGFYFKNNLLQCTEDYKKLKEWLENDKQM